MNKLLQIGLISAIFATSGFAGGKTSSFDNSAVLMDGANIASGNTATMDSTLYNFGEIKATEGSATITTSKTSGTIYNGYTVTEDTTNSADDDFKAKVSAFLGNCTACSSSGDPCYDSGTYQVTDVWKIGTRGTIDENVTYSKTGDNSITVEDLGLLESTSYQNDIEEEIFKDHRVFNLVIPETSTEKVVIISDPDVTTLSNVINPALNTNIAFVSIPADGEETPSIELSSLNMATLINMPIFRGYTGDITLKGRITMNNKSQSDLVMQGKVTSDGNTSVTFNSTSNETTITFNEEVDVSKTGATFEYGTYVFRKKLTI